MEVRVRSMLFRVLGAAFFLALALQPASRVARAADSTNIAALATVTASSEATSTNQQAIKAVDGVPDGWPGDYTREWATLGERTGAWLKLSWSSAYSVDHVVLYDRPNTNDRITGATLTFSDGATVAVGALINNGSAVTVNFTPHTTTSLTLTVTSVSGATLNIGLAEIEVYGAAASGGGGGNPLASNACLSTPVNTSATGSLDATDPGGLPLTYSILDQATKGTVTIDIAGNFLYTPSNPNFRGMDKFTFRATDSDGLQSNVGTVWILIDGAVRIMPLGDSITQGIFKTGDGSCTADLDGDCPVRSQRISYRLKLSTDLEALSPNYGVRMVGSLVDGSAAGLSPPNDRHEGHPGDCPGPITAGNWCTLSDVYDSSISRNLSDNISTWLDTNQPDIILLHAGTNGLNFATASVVADHMDTLLTEIDNWAAAKYPITVFVARIIPTVSDTFNVSTFNNDVAAIPAANHPHIRVIMVDENSQLRLGSDPNHADPNLMASELHPNQMGYDKMADKWKQDMISSGVLPCCQ
jgi:lysophospholipase L1-like esterase